MKTEYVTREEFDKFTKYHGIGVYLLFGLIFIVPVLYSITANTKNYVGFYGIGVVGLIFISCSVIKYLKWRKKYV